MKQVLDEIVRKTPLYPILRRWSDTRKLEAWQVQGKPTPPPHIVKQLAIRSMAEQFNLHTLVETGTYYGDMVEAMRGDFSKIFSIELSPELHKKAKKRFSGDGRIEIIQGDSGIELGKLIGRIEQPALFWLDGHYSAGVTARGVKDTPIYEELTHILNSQQIGHVIIIDDARCFGKDPAYPSIDELREFITRRVPSAVISVENDSVRITHLS